MAQGARIHDPADPRIAAYCDVRERDLVGREGRFIAEGEVVLRLLLRQGRFPLESVLLSEGRAGALAPLMAEVPAGVPVYVAAQAVMDRIAGFPIHRGVLAVGRRSPDATPDERLGGLPRRALVVAPVGITNHDNVGGIFRNAAAFGAAAVLLDPTCCDPLYRKAIRVSVGASLTVPFARARSIDHLLASLTAASFELIGLSPRGAHTLCELRSSDRVALVLGAEGPGLPDEVLSRTRTVRIPMAPGFDSLNIATASGIALHHLAASGTFHAC